MRIVQQMRSLGLDKVRVYGGGDLVSQKYIDLGGQAVKSIVATWAYVDPAVPRAKALGEKYEQHLKRKMDVFMAQGYDAMHILAEPSGRAGRAPAIGPRSFAPCTPSATRGRSGT